MFQRYFKKLPLSVIALHIRQAEKSSDFSVKYFRILRIFKIQNGQIETCPNQVPKRSLIKSELTARSRVEIRD